MTRRSVVALLALCAAAALLVGCSYLRGAAIPIWSERHAAPAGEATRLVVLLPGIGDEGGDFVERGFVERLQRVDPTLDVVTVDAHVGYYVRGLLAERVHQDIVAPRRADYREVWLVGISLGGLGAMTYAAAYPQAVDGVVLLAPYLGGDEVVAEVRAAGGVRSWVSPELERFEEPMRRLAHGAWTWARAVAESQAPRPVVYLGYGAEDRFAPGHALLASVLPADRVRVLPGGHEWTVWSALFDDLSAAALRR